MKKIITFFALLTIAFTTQAQEKTIQKSFSGIKSIQLSTSSGNISVKKSSGREVSLTIRHSFDENVFTPVIEERNGNLILKEDFVSGNHSGSSSWNLTIPDNITLDVNSGSGNLALTDVNVQVKTNLGSGDIDLTNVKGKLSFNTGSGNSNITDTSGELHINTGSGEITARGGTGTFHFNAGSGDIDLERLQGTFEVNTGSGDIEADGIAFQGEGKFNTGSGDALVNLSGNLGHSISINSGSGNATLNFNGAPIEGEVIMTANQRNGEIVAPFKFDNEETIEERGSSPRIRKTAKLSNKNVTIKVGTGSGTAKIAK